MNNVSHHNSPENWGAMFGPLCQNKHRSPGRAQDDFVTGHIFPTEQSLCLCYVDIL